MKIKYLYIVIVGMAFLTSCGSHRNTVKYRHYKPKRHKDAVVVIPKEDIIEAKAVFKKIKRKTDNGTQVTLKYIDNFAPLAIIEMKKYKIPASITLAQGILESRSGQSELSLKSNNHFGVKCHKGWTGDYVLYDDDKNNECFRKYTHPIGSFKDHSLFLRDRERYAFLFKLRRDNYKAWARGLKKAGYATDPRYPGKLIKIIEGYQLYRYDEEVLHHKKYKKANAVDFDEQDVALKDTIVAIKKNDIVKDSVIIDKNLHKKIQDQTYTVEKGDTLYAISKKFGVKVADLKHWNHLTSNDLSVNQVLVIKKNAR